MLACSRHAFLASFIILALRIEAVFSFERRTLLFLVTSQKDSLKCCNCVTQSEADS